MFRVTNMVMLMIVFMSGISGGLLTLAVFGFWHNKQIQKLTDKFLMARPIQRQPMKGELK